MELPHIDWISTAAIFGLEGQSLSEKERKFFTEIKPFGFILFTRNIQSPSQLSSLCQELKSINMRDDTLILIDQEGGRVQRLKPPHWSSYPSARHFGDVYAKDEALARQLANLNYRILARELAQLGISGNCLPVLDLSFSHANGVIGDRAYSHDPQIVSELGRLAADALLAERIWPIFKHIPGHGRARLDSHLALPRVKATQRGMALQDWLPFQNLSSYPFAMTAHIVYSAFDKRNPATLSPIVIQDIIRKKIGFDGLLITDDLSMKALSGTLAERASLSLAAGCDVVLHCSGILDEMQEVAKACRRWPEASHNRWLQACTLRNMGQSDAINERSLPSLRAELADLWATLA